jgi:hypothetical protein
MSTGRAFDPCDVNGRINWVHLKRRGEVHVHLQSLPACVAVVLLVRVIHWLKGQRVEGWAPLNLVRFAIEFAHPSPVDGLTILIHLIHRALYHVTFGWGVGDRSILGLAGRELRFAFVERPSAHERIGSKGCCGCC